ncbi:MAG: hypothetical protein LUC27_07785 [Lachnospiraceae bacterium]|nr:hypothetical protein [Lachnospiraceae bacterium]
MEKEPVLCYFRWPVCRAKTYKHGHLFPDEKLWLKFPLIYAIFMADENMKPLDVPQENAGVNR